MAMAMREKMEEKREVGGEKFFVCFLFFLFSFFFFLFSLGARGGQEWAGAVS
jgi:hypothetical protein